MGQLYSIKEETLVAIADNVRAITGTTGELTPGEMTTSSTEISTEVDTQTELIEQIQTALEGKASGSGGVILPTLNNEGAATDLLANKELIDSNGNKVTGTMKNNGAVNTTIEGLVNGTSNPVAYTIPEGYHNGQGKVQISSDVKTLHNDIAAAIRSKGQTVSLNYNPLEFPDHIRAIQTSEDLSAELTEQANLISQQQTLISNLETALENKAGGSGGGGSVETCTVTITTPTTISSGRLFVSRFVDDEVNYNPIYVENGSFVINDVICGQQFVLYVSDFRAYMGYSITASDNVETCGYEILPQGGEVFSFVCTSGASATITLTVMDI